MDKTKNILHFETDGIVTKALAEIRPRGQKPSSTLLTCSLDAHIIDELPGFGWAYLGLFPLLSLVPFVHVNRTMAQHRGIQQVKPEKKTHTTGRSHGHTCIHMS